MNNSIGGYFELELSKKEEYHKNSIRLNTGRNALEYILLANSYTKLYIPYYTCEVILEPLKKLNIDYQFYSIDKTLSPIFDFNSIKENEAFLYTNYFGICDKIVSKLSLICKNLIIDNAQSFFSTPISNINTFYSPRKFFGVPDGAYLYSKKLLDQNFKIDSSIDRFDYLIGRIEFGAENFYNSFKKTEDSLKSEPIKQMSYTTKAILSSIDYNEIKKKRIENFNKYDEALNKSNKLKFELTSSSVPMIYPYLIENASEIKKKLISNKIFVATYWPNVKQWANDDSFELFLYKNLLCLPIDQRYDFNDIERVLKHLSSTN